MPTFQPTHTNPVPSAPQRAYGPTQYNYPEQAHYGPGTKDYVQSELPPSYQEPNFVNNPAVQNVKSGADLSLDSNLTKAFVLSLLHPLILSIQLLPTTKVISWEVSGGTNDATHDGKRIGIFTVLTVTLLPMYSYPFSLEAFELSSVPQTTRIGDQGEDKLFRVVIGAMHLSGRTVT
ncbi:hypothetical protein MD484_g8437, partial [Candolleomyces efflorescens]